MLKTEIRNEKQIKSLGLNIVTLGLGILLWLGEDITLSVYYIKERKEATFLNRKYLLLFGNLY